MRRLAHMMGLSALIAGAAPAVSAETLRDALAAAYLNNPQLDAQRTSSSIAEERINQARAQRLPTVDVFGSYVYESIDSNRPIAINLGNRPVATAQVEARLPLYTGGRIAAGVRQAQAGSLAADAQYESAAQSLMLDTVTAYVDILRDQQIISIRENSLELLGGQLTASQDRFDVGDVTRTDVALSEARLEGGRAQLAAAEAQLAGSLAFYTLLTGLEPSKLQPVPPLPPLPQTQDEALAAALASNPDIDAARFAERAAREGISVARGALRPEVSAIAQAGVQEYHTDGFTDTSVVAGAQARIPLFAGGRNSSALREAKLARSQAQAQITLIERALRANVARAWYGLEATQRSVQASQRQVEAAEIAYEGAQEELSVGFRTTLDVLDQEQQLLEARLALATSERDRYVAAHQLLAAMGQLSPEQMGLGSR